MSDISGINLQASSRFNSIKKRSFDIVKDRFNYAFIQFIYQDISSMPSKIKPAKTERGRRDEGTASSRGGGVLAMLTTIFPGGPFKRGREKKSLKKLRKRFGGNDKNALSLHPLSLLKKRRR